MYLSYHKPCSLHTVIVFYDFVPAAQFIIPLPMMAYISYSAPKHPTKNTLD